MYKCIQKGFTETISPQFDLWPHQFIKVFCKYYKIILYFKILIHLYKLMVFYSNEKVKKMVN